MILIGLYGLTVLSFTGLLGAVISAIYQNHQAHKQFARTMRNIARFDMARGTFIKFAFHRSAGF
ncbi:MAG: hypothetical protein COB76_06670 [Alphaproteobacteria bacterium]|nr:MAG: hypothetical protein COB76_06670 [Alphaproteobacteria bacterium]